jgi:hypothetical protein
MRLAVSSWLYLLFSVGLQARKLSLLEVIGTAVIQVLANLFKWSISRRVDP